MNKPKVGILTNFTGSDEAFSLVVVVKTQLEMLIEAGYNPVLFTADTFKGTGIWSDNRIEVRRTVPFTSSVAEIADSLRGMIGDINVMLCHDILFIDKYDKWGKAVRILINEMPQIRWLHWQHSRGDHAPIEKVGNSDFCYPNQGDLPHVAAINSTDMEHVHYVPHPLDFNYLGWPELAVRIAEDYQFPFVDIAMIYPTRPEEQKQINKSIRIFAGLKKAGKSVCLLVADAYATGEPFLTVKKNNEKLAEELGLTDKEFAFLGNVYPECKFWTPRPTVKALFEMSNLFIQTSNAETSSLVAMEAAIAGNLVIINGNFKPIHHLYEKALLLPFGAVTQSEPEKYYRIIHTADGKETRIEDEQFYWDDQARNLIIPVLNSQLTIALKRQQLRDRWPSRVFKDFMEPILLKDWTPPVLECKGDKQVTAIICTLDNLPMLKRQLDILMQEVGHIIVVNNGSKDGTKEWLDENPILGMKVIHRENRGAGPGRNAGLAAWESEPTVYTLMLDGGILPPLGGVALLKAYLLAHTEVSVISPEIASCFTTNEQEATTRVSQPIEVGFPQSMLSSTAYCLCHFEAWKVKFSEDGPFGEPGWGVDDNDMAFRWDRAGVVHHDFTNSSSGWKLYRRQSGSHKRLEDETGIYPTQYGSVYEKRCVKLRQDWGGMPSASYIIQDVLMPDFAALVKRLHEDYPTAEVLASDYDPFVKDWLDIFALRQPWGDTAIDTDGRILKRGDSYPEELWSGDVVRDRGPMSENVIVINMDNVDEFLRERVLQAV